MATRTLTTPPLVLTPTDDPTPVERAVVDGLVGDFEPETFLWIVFHRPDGGAHVWYAWTVGGAPLGDAIDQTALAAGYDCSDWFHIGNRHLSKHTRGRVTTDSYPLRPIEADIRNGLRAPETERDRMRRLIEAAHPASGQTCPEPTTDVPWWLGVGPALVTRTGS
ncbi:hypothetical protein EYS09_15435 [Streptomyces kasugaensis]|uniref:Uncharacterized protein n=1 Tax=Streptomyces kasugaensis TaxID=1946 RepID=A0A4Q9HUK8_STRKA|nr:hypothetical protein [Streptomyces kasugaensis]TBO58827.1 hypothetical protein EYS09_15435 [Streptomyces kasugaensis]